MSTAGTFLADALLAGAIVAILAAAAVWLGCRFSTRPATRHLLWSAVLLSFVAPGAGLALSLAASHASPLGLGVVVQFSRTFAPAHVSRPPQPRHLAATLGSPAPSSPEPWPYVVPWAPSPPAWSPSTSPPVSRARAPQTPQSAESPPPVSGSKIPSAPPHPLSKLRRAVIAQGFVLLLIWASGALPLMVAIIVGVLKSRRLVRRATPATEETVRTVNAASRAMNLARRPAVRFTTQRVSPMLVVGLRPSLILPRELWQRLEPEARASIIVHELAHLRRRDHWFSWAFALVVTVFWWHPIAWWALARARNEAEEACDAWVTAMAPASRRTYAEAIVATQELIGTCGEGVSPRLCVVSGGVLRLRRRITMVMTSRVSPRGSWAGIAAGALLPLAGVLATPGLACPPEAQPAGGAPSRPAFQASAGMFASQPDAPADRLAEMLARLDARLSAIEARLQTAPTTAPAIAVEGFPVASAPRANSPSESPGGPTQPALAETAPGSVPRSYTLSAGKLRALSDLMSRQDVPIWVTPGEDRIEILATPQQHEVFAAFLAMIEPASATRVASDVPLGLTSRPRAGVPISVELQRAVAERSLADAQRAALSIAEHQDELSRRVDEVLSLQQSADDTRRTELEKSYRDLLQARAALEARLEEAQAAVDVAKARLRALEAERAALPPAGATTPSAPAAPRAR
ncbi:MAG: hypothetical protein DYG92_01330 [Leptolyngbya sp. PLA1]|nr:hypothetical protein [Leptolyngbya sp. PLA1]